MPPDAVPFVVAVIVAFLVFIVVIGGVSIWTHWPDRRL